MWLQITVCPSSRKKSTIFCSKIYYGCAICARVCTSADMVKSFEVEKVWRRLTNHFICCIFKTRFIFMTGIIQIYNMFGIMLPKIVDKYKIFPWHIHIRHNGNLIGALGLSPKNEEQVLCKYKYLEYNSSEKTSKGCIRSKNEGHVKYIDIFKKNFFVKSSKSDTVHLSFDGCNDILPHYHMEQLAKL